VRPPNLPVLCVLASTAALGADFSGSVRGWVGGGVDTNPARDFISPDGGAAVPDGFLQGIVNLNGGVGVGPFEVDGTYDIGARKFITQPSQDTVIQSATLLATLFLPKGFSLNIDGRARDRRGAERDYSDLLADFALGYAPDGQLDFRIRAGAHRFIFWVPEGYRESFFGPEAGITARYRFNKHHAFNAFGEVSFRTFNSPQYKPNDDPTQPDVSAVPIPGTIRGDTYFLVGASYTYKGPVNATLSYSYLDSTSNSFGESYRQHRIGLLVGVALPWELTFLLNGQLRLSSYPDGIFLSADILPLLDDENLSSVSVKLVRPIGEHVDIDLRYAFFYGTLPTDQFVYLRHTASLGVSVRF
jgi:hypothetical protein